jgi:hypothetical protein
MATTVGLKFDMSASIGRFQKSMDRVERRLDSLDRASRKAASGIGLLAKLQIGGALIKGVGMLAGAFRSATGSAQQFFDATLERVDALGKLSSSIGVAVEPLQVLGKAASEAGVGQDKLGEAFKRMNKRIAEATMGFGEALPALQRLGLSADELSKMSPDQAFRRIGQAISELPSKGLQAATAFKIFSDQGLSLIPLFEDFPAKIKATEDRFISLGLGVNTVQTKNIEALNDTLGEVQSVIASIGGKVIGNIAPAVDVFLNQILDSVANFEMGEATAANAIADYLTEAIFKGAIVLGDFADNMISRLMQAFTFMAKLVEKLAAIFSFFAPDAISPEGKETAAKAAAAEKKTLELVRQAGPMVSIEEQAAIEQQRERAQRLRAKAKQQDDAFIQRKYGIGDPASLPSVGVAARLGAQQFATAKIDAATTTKEIAAAAAMADRIGVGGVAVRDATFSRTKDLQREAERAAKQQMQQQERRRAVEAFGPRETQKLPGIDAMERGQQLAGFDLLPFLTGQKGRADLPGIAGRVERQLQAGLSAGAAAENDPFAQRQAAIDKLRREGELAAENNKRAASAGLEIFKQTAERNIEQFRANPMAARIAASQGMSVDDFIDKKSSQDMERFLANQRQQQQRFVAPQSLEADRLQAQLDADIKRAEQRAAVMRARAAAQADAAARPGAAAAGAAQPDDKVASKLDQTNRLLAEANRSTRNSFVLATIG